MSQPKNILTESLTQSDYGEFADPKIPQTNEYIFVNDSIGYTSESEFRIAVKQIMKEELSNLLMDISAFQEIGGSLYYGTKRLVYASDIFLT